MCILHPGKEYKNGRWENEDNYWQKNNMVAQKRHNQQY